MEVKSSPEERHLVALLEQCQNEIAKLEAQLKQQQKIRANLETDLLVFHSRTAPINRVPQDILLMIFEEFKRDLEDPLDIGSILYVCRKWNMVATNSPSLWMAISLILEPDVATIERHGDYVKTATRCSKTSPLDIGLSLPSIRPFPSETPSNLPSEDVEEPGAVDSLLRDNFIQDLVLYEDVDGAVLKFMRTIAGSNGENIHRLRSLNIYFSRENFSSWLRDKPFQYLTPILKELVIETGYGEGVHFPLLIHPAPNLSRIACSPGYPLGNLLSPNGNISDLRIFFGEWDSSRGILHHQSLRNLKNLALDLPTLPTTAESQQEIIFPFLEDLTLFGDCPLGFIRAPRLITLRLLEDQDYSSDFYNTIYFPSVRRLHTEIYLHEIGAIEKYVDELPVLTEIGLLSRQTYNLKDCLRRMESTLRGRNITVKAYACSVTASSLGFFPYQYENEELRIGD